MICKKCGKEIENDVTYCPNCGEMCNEKAGTGIGKKVDIKRGLSENVFKSILVLEYK